MISLGRVSEICDGSNDIDCEARVYQALKEDRESIIEMIEDDLAYEFGECDIGTIKALANKLREKL